MDSKITLAVVIPTWSRPLQLRRLLHSLHHQIRQPDEIVVACRSGDSASTHVVSNWKKCSHLASKVKVVEVPETGHIPPLVKALQVCESDIFCQIDDDAIPRKDWLTTLEQDFNNFHLGGICGKVINHIEGNPGLDGSMVSAPAKLSWFGRQGKCGRKPQINGSLFKANCFSGGNMAFRKNALIGSFDMRLNRGDSIAYETDLALNVQAKGFRVLYDPRAIVDHYPAPRKIDTQRGWNSKECFCYAHNHTYICLKHLRWYGKLSFFIYFFIGGQWGCPAPITYILSLISRRPVSWREQFIPSMRGRLKGIRTYTRYLREVKKS